ncbi:hypothetical protein [Deinococcus sp. QL22]|uniref:hypothetical protein n=1 Tax=Deinococcus sp. QL22 TaxID=2939437 RepID=UPI0020179B00|nr:hypothetical protein [Deinococcus sp. QL22]UQN05482.1 hypothetical protein M1R55_11410 [Deinococcus sp. QL22]
MQSLRQHFQTQVRQWWATPVINQFLILLGYILALLSLVHVLMPGAPPGLNWGSLLMPLYLSCLTLSTALETAQTPTSERRRFFTWSTFVFSLLFVGWTLLMILSRP